MDFFFDTFGFFGWIISLAGVGLAIWGIVDAAPRPDVQWAAAQQNKQLWMALLIGSAVLSFCCIGIAGAVAWAIYWFVIRTKLEEAKGGGAIGGEPMPPAPPPPPQPTV